MNTAAVVDVTDFDVSEPRAAQVPAVQPQRNALAMTTPADLLRIAVERGADLSQLEKLMDLQERYEAKQAKRDYDAAFSAFKAEAVVILKGRKVTDGPLRGKSYAELHDVVNAVTWALSKHGLSSSWKLTMDEKDWMQVTCYLRHVNGHEESVSMGGPPDAGGAKNAIQARASTKTYLERYTLKAITGLSEQEDDDDGMGGNNQPAAAQRTQPAGRPAQAAAPEYYDQKKFDANKDTWREMVKSGRKTTEGMIQFIESKGARLTTDQQNTIDSWGHEND
jgi:hypothetical protein